jgi:hypothetical protein
MGNMFSAHSFLNMTLFLGSASMTFHGLLGESGTRKEWILGLALWMLYPLVTELLMNIKAKMFA